MADQQQTSPEPIPAEQINAAAEENKVQNRSRPSGCYCGRYIFYSALCGHEYKQVPLTCGGQRTPSGRTGFCTVPAPRHIVAVRVGEFCPHCPPVT